MPAGLTLNTSTGVISGTPTSTTAASFTIRATDVNACQGSRAFTLTPVCPTITLSPASLPVGYVGAAYSQALSSTGGSSPYTYTITTGTLVSSDTTWSVSTALFNAVDPCLPTTISAAPKGTEVKAWPVPVGDQLFIDTDEGITAATPYGIMHTKITGAATRARTMQTPSQNL